MQDSFALCRVFKKNGICSEIEEQQGQSSHLTLNNIHERSQGVNNDHCDQTLSPENPMASSSSISCPQEEDDKDDSWMQFITDDTWMQCSSNAGVSGEDQLSHVAFTN
ncbi:hypothetical protein C1H46_020188 [Malus baccata]|uniref:NAC domain-containing protein n=1 Tax=Malus baccata TaxID=106549 RepID=A0A540M6A0_MALBA|nr:hypothetical protein C1H46_020188 [Malus baccata]